MDGNGPEGPGAAAGDKGPAAAGAQSPNASSSSTAAKDENPFKKGPSGYWGDLGNPDKVRAAESSAPDAQVDKWSGRSVAQWQGLNNPAATAPKGVDRRPTRFTMFNKAVKSSSIFRKIMVKVFGTPYPEQQYARYGFRATSWRMMSYESKYSIVLAILMYTSYLHYHDNRNKDELLANIELNRQQFYKTPFHPEYVGVPAGESIRDIQAIYESPTVGYMQIDKVSGLKETFDHRLAGPNIDEMIERVKNAPVSDQMLKDIMIMRKIQDVGQKAAYGEGARRVF
jgi:hypothetical protein